MSPTRLILRSLLHHWRINLAVALGVMAATAVLTGALLVGDSMRGSLRFLAVDRLGRIDEVLLSEHFFRAELAQELAAAPAFKPAYEDALAVILLQGTLENAATSRRAAQVTVLGTDDRFWSLAEGPAPELPEGGNDFVVLNQALADELGIEMKPGGDRPEVLLRLPRISNIPEDSPLGRKTDTVENRRLTVTAIVPTRGLGRFSLRPSQQDSRNAYVRLATLQSILKQPGKANGILVAGHARDQAPDPAASQALQGALRPTLADYGLVLERFQLAADDKAVLDYIHLTSDQMMLPDSVSTAAMKALAPYHPQPALTYLANWIQAGPGEPQQHQGKIPYSTVTAIDSTATLGPVVDDQGKPIELAGDEIVLNSWAANDLAEQGVMLMPGDPVELTYFEPEATHRPQSQGDAEQTRTFRLKAVVKLAAPGESPLPANDRGLTPEVPGLTDRASIASWDPPFTYYPERVRARPPKNNQDDDYWKKYKTTPKAFISLAEGQKLWESRFGRLTSIRVPVPAGASDQDAQRLQAELTEILLKGLVPADQGLAFRPIKRQSLQAAQGTTSFDQLFLGFSMFIIAAAVMLVALLFRLGVEQRAAEIGLLVAVGLRRRLVLTMLVVEGLIVAAIGGLLGIALGVGYAWLMLAGLTSWWVAAIVSPFLTLYVTPQSLAIGYASGVIVSGLTIVWTLWRMRKVAVRRLMNGEAAAPVSAAARRRSWAPRIAWGLLALAVVIALGATQLVGEAEAGAFFGSGALVLTSLLMLIFARLRGGSVTGESAGGLALAGLAMRNAGRNPGRSTLTIGLVASASFLIVAISAFRVDPSLSGAGGFDVFAESSQPVFFDLNTARGRKELNFPTDTAAPDPQAAQQAQTLKETTILSLRLQAGDDASCLNLYQPQRPRIIGVTPAMVEHFSQPGVAHFAWGETAAQSAEEKTNPWLLLDAPPDPAADDAIPVVLDMATAMYSMHLFVMQGTGTVFEVDDDRGGKIRLRIVGLLSNSIFQGSLLISEDNFKRLFPEVSGYRMFLAQSPAGKTDEVISLMEDRLGDQGLDAESARKKLASLLAVQNTYLSTFQSLGALGLLLGTFGLATVQLRNVFERRRELALMRAAGFRRARLGRMVMIENSLLLLGGLLTGIAAAAVAVLPHWLSGGAAVPVDSLAVMLGIVMVVGLASGMAAVRATLRAPILSALRGE